MTFCRTCCMCWQFLTTTLQVSFQCNAQQLLLKWQDHSLWDFHHSQSWWDQAKLMRSLFSFFLIPNNFLDHLILVPLGSFDSYMCITSRLSRTFQVCICVMVSCFNRKFRNLLFHLRSPGLTYGQCCISFQ